MLITTVHRQDNRVTKKTEVFGFRSRNHEAYKTSRNPSPSPQLPRELQAGLVTIIARRVNILVLYIMK